MSSQFSSRERMLSALHCQTPDHPPCSFMIFGALHQRADSYLDFVERQLSFGLDAFVMLPPRPPMLVNDYYNLHGLPVTYHSDVKVTEAVVHSEKSPAPLLVKTYHTPAGDLRTRVRQTEDWRWGDHVPFLDDYLIPRSEKFIVETGEDLAAFQYLLQPLSEDEIAAFRSESAPAIDYARSQNLLLAGGWGVGADLIGWVHGLNSLVYDVYDQPDFIRDLIRMIGNWNRRRMAVSLEMPIDLYIKRAWYENCDFFTPGVWKKLIQPELRADVALAHQAGVKFGYIITDSAMPLLDLIVETGVDVLIGVDPETYDLAATKETVAGEMCLWGGVNGHLTVEQGTSEAVKGEVTAALQSLGPDGFILSPVDNIRQHTALSMNNVNTLIQTWQHLTHQI